MRLGDRPGAAGAGAVAGCGTEPQVCSMVWVSGVRYMQEPTNQGASHSNCLGQEYLAPAAFFPP